MAPGSGRASNSRYGDRLVLPAEDRERPLAIQHRCAGAGTTERGSEHQAFDQRAQLALEEPVEVPHVCIVPQPVRAGSQRRPSAMIRSSSRS